MSTHAGLGGLLLLVLLLMAAGLETRDDGSGRRHSMRSQLRSLLASLPPVRCVVKVGA